MSLLIEEISPSADSLCQSYSGKYQVGQLQEVDPVMSADKNRDKDTGNDTAVNSQAAAANIEDPSPIARIVVPAENSISSSGKWTG